MCARERQVWGMLAEPSLAEKGRVAYPKLEFASTPPSTQDQEAITAFMPFSRFLNLPTDLRHEVYKLHFLEIRVVNLGFRSQHSRRSQISAPSPSPIELLCVSQTVSCEAAPVIYRRTIFECTRAQEFSSFLMSLSSVGAKGAESSNTRGQIRRPFHSDC